MSFITILFLALSLSADAFAVAVGTGISQKKVHKKEAIAMALSFGIFQGVMPIVWFFMASLLPHSILEYNHWIAFLLLGYIGCNMMYEWWKNRDTDTIQKNIFALRSLIILGIATSIDALAVGVSLTASTTDITFPAITIGVVTFFVSYLWVRSGEKFSKHIWSRAEIIWGLILIGIWIKILLDHLLI